MPDNAVFVEDFRVFYSDDGLHVKFKSKYFDTFMKRLSKKETPTKMKNVEGLGLLFDIKEGTEIYPVHDTFLDNEPSLSCLALGQTSLVTPQATIGANLSFLSIAGLDKGVDVPILYPVSVSDALDYYYAALQGFQQLYSEWIRPFTLGAVMTEVKEKEGS
jgi:hypothetical protein